MDFENFKAGLVCTMFYVPYLILQCKIFRDLRGWRSLVASLPLPLFALYGLGPFFIDLSRMQSWDAMAFIYAFGLVTALISAAWSAVLHALLLPKTQVESPPAV